ncbi:MAG TPA: M48 family metallopeptidase [Prolixibacteraceae bacterium]|nr:M48 family metallopeptidase [Prolixibacteraceae bacterium]
MENLFFYSILFILVADFLFERILDYLNHTHWSNVLPEALKGIYDEETYRHSQEYKRVNYRFEAITSGFSFLLILCMLLWEGFAWVNNLSLAVSDHVILSALIFFGILGLASDLLTTPFALYDTFVIEERFGFNKTTVKTFIADKLKGWLLAALLGGGLLSLVIFFWLRTGNHFWLWAWGFLFLVSLFMALFYSNLIVPLFNKQSPLNEGELKDAIMHFANQAGFKLKNIYIIDGSKRSTKANAYFTGLGPKKRIVLYDTLIHDLTNDEIVAVLAHEIGHYKKRHTLWGLLSGFFQTGIMLYLFSLLVSSPALSKALGVDEPSFPIGLVAFGILYSPVSFIIGTGMNLFSRKHEYEADAFAARYGWSEALASALKKLSVKNLSNLTPHPLYVFFHYSHPTLLQRLKRLESN